MKNDAVLRVLSRHCLNSHNNLCCLVTPPLIGRRDRAGSPQPIKRNPNGHYQIYIWRRPPSRPALPRISNQYVVSCAVCAADTPPPSACRPGRQRNPRPANR